MPSTRLLLRSIAVIILNLLTGVYPAFADSAVNIFELWPDFFGPEQVVQALADENASPRSISKTDLDGDGVPDLLVGYRLADGTGAIAWFPGNIKAVYPHSSSDSQKDTPSETPFSRSVRVWALPWAADFLASGDFDADGKFDLVSATHGEPRLMWLAGDGKGTLSSVRQLPLGGAVTALTAGEVNRRDGLVDIVVAVSSKVGPSVQVFESPLGALRSAPEALPLSAPVTALALGKFDSDVFHDIALLSDNELLAIGGRDRKLSWPRAVREGVPSARIESVQPATAWSRDKMSRALRPAESLEGFQNVVTTLPARLNADGLNDLVVLTDDARRIGFVLTQPSAIYTVNASDDADDGLCDASHCSLREAIVVANELAGSDVIEFNIGGGGLQTITPTSALPTITDTVTFDGMSQPGYTGSPIIEISGSSAGAAVSGLEIKIAAEGSVVRGLVVRDFQRSGIRIEAPGSLVEGNFIGSDSTGLLAAPNSTGVYVGSGCLNCQIGGSTTDARNLISANLSDGIQVHASNEGYSVLGNFIGTTVDGTAPLGNNLGVRLDGISAILGGPSPGEGNVVSGNNGSGVFCFGVDAIVQGNKFGVDPTGTAAVLNGDDGVLVTGPNHLVGGTSPAMANIFSGNGRDGLGATSAPSLEVKGNYAGTNPFGDALGNGVQGVSIRSNNSLVGGTEPEAGNFVAFNTGYGLGQFSINVCSLQNTFRTNVLAASDGNAQDRPVLTNAASDNTSIVITGSQTGTPNATYRIEFFANATCHASGFGEGEKYLGFAEVTTDAAGEATFTNTFSAAVAVGDLITATGSLLGDTFTCETSAFSLCQPVEELPDPTAPELQIPSNLAAAPNTPVTVPVHFVANGHDIAATVFSIDFDHTCLSFNPDDDDLDGVPDAIEFLTPAVFNVGATYDGTDSDGEIDVAISDGTLPFTVLADSTLLTIELTPTCDPFGSSTILAPVEFANDPAASWGNTDGESVPGVATNGSIEIFSGARGDCNGDGLVDAGDLVALTLELFDDDGNFWLDVPGGSFAGDPVGCDANADTIVDAGDTVCATLLIFGGSCSAPSLVFGSMPRLDLSTSRAGDTVLASIEIDSGDHDLSALVFSLDLDSDLILDPTDSDGDGIPDAITFHTEASQKTVVFDPSDQSGELDFLLNDLNAVPMPFSGGLLIEIQLTASTPESMLRFSSETTGSFGSTSGWSIEGKFSVGGIFRDGFESGDLTTWSRVRP